MFTILWDIRQFLLLKLVIKISVSLFAFWIEMQYLFNTAYLLMQQESVLIFCNNV